MTGHTQRWYGFTRRSLIALPPVLLVLVSCTPYGHWGRYDWWRDNYPEFPSYEKVERVVEIHKDLIEQLIYKQVSITPCPDGAFITFYSKNKAGALKLLDEADARSEGLTMFYGAPFRFIRDQENCWLTYKTTWNRKQNQRGKKRQ